MLQTFSGLAANLIAGYMSRDKRSITVGEKHIKSSFRDHLEASYNKCKRIKTILSDEPVDFMNIYIDQSFKVSDETVDQYAIAEMIRDGDSLCVIGTGGGGKSILMRYLWISMFVHSEGKIPVFLELRHLNNYTHKNIEDFIYHSIISSGSEISQKSFREALRQGEFIVFLDGFDEINYELRQDVDEKIIKLKENNPRLSIIVTSRPDERFVGWHQFSTVHVLPLTKDQSLELINKANFNEEYVEKLVSKINVKKGLYESHKSFLSNPLLSYMMLVTISYSPDIPNSMYHFYDQAFEALYHRHDLTKGSYKRKFYSKLDKQSFIGLVSYFCFITYMKQSFEFKERELYEFASKAITVEECDVKAEELIQDLLESVCLLKKEGLEYSFTHRSFQEYFSARCVSSVASSNMEKVLFALSQRQSDNVLKMVHQIHPNVFREKYVIPVGEKFKDVFAEENLDIATLLLFSSCEAKFRVALNNGYLDIVKLKSGAGDWSSKRTRISFFDKGELSFFVKYARSCEKITQFDELKVDRNADNEFVYWAVKEHVSGEIGTFEIYCKNGNVFLRIGRKNISNKELQDKFMKTRMFDFLLEKTRIARQFYREEEDAFRTINQNLNEYSGIPDDVTDLF